MSRSHSLETLDSTQVRFPRISFQSVVYLLESQHILDAIHSFPMRLSVTFGTLIAFIFVYIHFLYTMCFQTTVYESGFLASSMVKYDMRKCLFALLDILGKT